LTHLALTTVRDGITVCVWNSASWVTVTVCKSAYYIHWCDISEQTCLTVKQLHFT